MVVNTHPDPLKEVLSLDLHCLIQANMGANLESLVVTLELSSVLKVMGKVQVEVEVKLGTRSLFCMEKNMFSMDVE